MQAIEQDFLLHLEPIFSRAILRHGGTNQNLPIGKRDHIGLGWISKKIAVDAGHGGAIDEREVNGDEPGRERPGQQRQRRLKPLQKWTNSDWHFALLV